MQGLKAFGVVAALSLTSCSPVCERAGNRINNFTRGNDVMAEPAAKLKEKPTKEAESEKKQPVLAGAHIEKFKPSTFKFDSMYTLYEDGKGNAQVRKGTEIVEEGEILDRRGNEGFTLFTKDGYEISFDKSGLGNITATPDEIRDRDRPISR